jgi:hypothetical protein
MRLELIASLSINTGLHRDVADLVVLCFMVHLTYASRLGYKLIGCPRRRVIYMLDRLICGIFN